MLRIQDLDLSQLLTFTKVIDAGSLEAAAQALHRSQPAISMRIQQLEATLDTTLFEKVGRRLQPTPIGRMLFENLKPLEAHLRDVITLLDHETQTLRGVYRVGTLPTLGVYKVATTLVTLKRAYPDLALELDYGLNDALLADLHGGRLDLCVTIGDKPTGSVRTVNIGQVTAALVLPKKHALARCKAIKADDLRAETLFTYAPTSDPFYNTVWNFLKKHRLDTAVQLRVSHIQTLKTLVAAGGGLAIAPDYTVVEPTLCTRPIEGLRGGQQIWVNTRKTAADSTFGRAFIETIQKT